MLHKDSRSLYTVAWSMENDFRLDDANRIEGKILASAYQGASIEYEIAALGRALKARITNPKGEHQFQRGDEITVSFAAEDVMIVSEKTQY